MEGTHRAGVNVVVTLLGDFDHFSAKNIGDFLDNLCDDEFLCVTC
jgi:hypothetical protein